MNSPLNVGIIGVGAFMSRQHLPNLARNPRFRIHTLCDLNADLLRQRAAQYAPAKCTSRDDEVFRDPEVDVIFVGTRNTLHAPLLLKALAHGKPIFVEKPMTSTREETHRVLDAARGKQVTVGVGFNRRFAPAMVEAKRLFDDFRRGPAHVVYRIVDDHDIRPAYIFRMEEGGGHLLQEGCHIFDLLAWFLGREPVEVYAAGPLETDNMVTLTFSDGSLATIICGGKGGLYYPKECIEVFCNRTTLAVDQFYELRMEGPDGRRIRTFEASGPTTPDPAEGMTGFYRASFAQRPVCAPDDYDTQRNACRLSVDKGHAASTDAFGDALLANTPYSVGLVDGARATICALTALDSIRQHRPLAIRAADYGLG